MNPCYDMIVVGGGFYGVMLALAQARTHPACRVAVVEQAATILQGASYTNQARVHHGYHYPRCQQTAAAAAAAYQQFCQRFAPAIVRHFVHAYAIARQGSKVTASQFAHLCQHHQIPIQTASKEWEHLFTPGSLEQLFLVEEAAFCANTLRTLLLQACQQAQIALICNTKVQACIGPLGASQHWMLKCSGEHQRMWTQQVLLTTYDQINPLLQASHLPCIPLKHELCELLLLQPHPALKHLAITVMDGPFFSWMPFPAEHCHSLSHVRWTPQHTWWEDEHHPPPTQRSTFQSRGTAMVKDCALMVPLLQECQVIRSMYATKTILPSQEGSDGRSILWQSFAQAPNLHAILGAKLDNIDDAIAMLHELPTFQPMPTQWPQSPHPTSHPTPLASSTGAQG